MRKGFISFCLLFAMIATSVVFTSCNRDEPVVDDDIYHLPANLTRGEIEEILLNARNALSEINRISIATDENWVENDEEFRLRRRDAFDADARRFIQVIYRTPRGQQEYVQHIDYVSGDNRYFYHFSAGNVRREIRRPGSNASQYYFAHDRGNWINVTGRIPFVENGNIVTRDTTTTSNDTRLLERVFVLNAKKQIRKRTIRDRREDLSGNVIRIRNAERIWTYDTVNVSLPSGFSVSSFTDDRRSEYFAINVIWGEGMGENTFWRTPFGDAIYANFGLNSITRYAPRIAGRNIVGATVGDETFTFNGSSWSPSSIQITDNSTIINVIWGQASFSTNLSFCDNLYAYDE